MAKIRDIAGKLGLSPSTVSKALNGYAGVSAET
ncbi:MAG: LacI family DNA-binding transcriptional regulator, partial [Lachnospiraceae bacterium]|nr:LacI family DNA-binding transcriptional regulator [Lachnospiraceae bacterium]